MHYLLILLTSHNTGTCSKRTTITFHHINQRPRPCSSRSVSWPQNENCHTLLIEIELAVYWLFLHVVIIVVAIAVTCIFNDVSMLFWVWSMGTTWMFSELFAYLSQRRRHYHYYTELPLLKLLNSFMRYLWIHSCCLCERTISCQSLLSWYYRCW